MSNDIAMTKAEKAEARAMLARGDKPEDVASWIGCTMEQLAELQATPPPTTGIMIPHLEKQHSRTAAGLRDVLFDEIAALRSGASDSQRAMAVANLAKQIVTVAKAEADFICQRKNIGATVGDQPILLGSNVDVAE